MLIVDQIGQTIELKHPPSRIVSLVPSLTETVYEWAGHKLVGRTKFCIHPNSITATIPAIGGTKNPNINKILSLQPDLILANKEENRQEDIQVLSKEIPVWVSDIHNWESALQALKQLGEMIKTEAHASVLIDKWHGQYDLFCQTCPPIQLHVLYLIWQDPYMSIGQDTYIHCMLELLGLKSVTSEKTRYPQVDEDWIKAIEPDIIFLSSEPYPFKQKHIQQLQQISPNSKVLLVDGELFSWYGVRMKYTFDYFSSLRAQII